MGDFHEPYGAIFGEFAKTFPLMEYFPLPRSVAGEL